MLALSNRLRSEGVDCRIDQYEQSPPEDWPNWCTRQVKESEFVLVACTEAYLRRFEGREEPGKGLGATWEGFVITQELCNAQGQNRKFIPVTFSSGDSVHIPITLGGATRYDVSTADGYDGLYRRLTGQPAVVMPALGDIQQRPPRPVQAALPALDRKEDFRGPVWNVRLPRNPFFTGREVVLARLEKALQSRGAAALSGLGGVGKTQTAAHYAHLHRQEYQAVLWASAASQETLVSDFVSFADLLNLPQREEQDQQVAVAAVKQRLEAQLGWLLVLDNANDLEMAREFIPRDGKGQVLLTTQAHATGAIPRVEIENMLPEEGGLFLLRRTTLVAMDAPLTAAAPLDRSPAEAISKEVSGLPLALDQAGAYIEETGCGLTAYLDLYRKRGARLLKERRAAGAGHDLSVAATFSLSFEEVAKAGPAAAELLRFCAFLNPDAIPEEAIAGGAAELGPVLQPVASDTLELNAAIAETLKYSLLRRDPNARTLSIHRLVQHVIKDSMDEAQKRQWAERTVRAVNRAFPGVEFSNWNPCERLLPQALACAPLVEEWTLQFPEAARLLNRAGCYLNDRAHFA